MHIFDLYIDNNYILYLIFYISIIYYLGYIENKSCNCIITNKHYILKITCYIILIINILLLFGTNKNKTIKFYNVILKLLSIYALYLIYTHFNYLEKTKCTCGTNNLYLLHNSLKYVSIIAFIVIILGFML